MEKLKEVLRTILTIIECLIDFTFVILESPYTFIMCILLGYGKFDIIYVWLPVCGVMSIWIDEMGEFKYSIYGHILIRKLFKK